MKVKSLLRYPGGKTRAIKYLETYLPSDIQHLVSPFFGGGSFEFSCISKGISVSGSDIYKPLVSFWKTALTNANDLAQECAKWHPLSKQDFVHLQKIHEQQQDDFLQASYFYVLNRASFSGTTASGGMSTNHPRWTASSIDKLSNWKCNNLEICCETFETFIPRNSNHFMYLDPPYDLKNSSLYGNRGSTHRGFNHLLLREVLDCVDRWVLSYNDNPEIRQLYSDFEIVPLEWKYGMNSSKNSSEIIILKGNQ